MLMFKYILLFLLACVSLFSSSPLYAGVKFKEVAESVEIPSSPAGVKFHENICNERICDSFPQELSKLLTFTSINQCIANQEYSDSLNSEIPKCPTGTDELSFLDNTYPTGATFAIYTSFNDAMIKDLLKSYLSKPSLGTFNLVLPLDKMNKLMENKELMKLIDNENVNLVTVKTTPSVNVWMQDSFQFGTLKGKPALYQLAHHSEINMDVDERFGCEISRKCGIPYYIPEELNNPEVFDDHSSLNSGGNFEALPGGVMAIGIMNSVREGSGGMVNHKNMNFVGDRSYFEIEFANDIEKKEVISKLGILGITNIEESGIVKCVNYLDNECMNYQLTVVGNTSQYKNKIDNKSAPDMNDSRIRLVYSEEVAERTDYQDKLVKSLRKRGHSVLELDTSFLAVGHVDEFFSVVKNNKPAPCNFTVMMASPEKAFELIEKNANRNKEKECTDYSMISLIARGEVQVTKCSDKALEMRNKCREFSDDDDRFDACYDAAIEKGKNCKKLKQAPILTSSQQESLSSEYCINGDHVSELKRSEEYLLTKKENVGPSDTPTVSDILKKNKQKIHDALSKSTGCNKPRFLDVPVFYRDGASVTPDLVNGVVQTTPNGPSHFIAPKPYFKPFSDYLEQELKKEGVETSFVHDMEYHLGQGEIHCGTNSARICRP